MNTRRIVLLLFVMILAVVFTGCGERSSNVVADSTEEATETSEIATEAETETSGTQALETAAPATTSPESEQSEKEYTGIELAKMNMKDIISIMGGDYSIKKDIVSPAFSSEPINYYYNDSVLPGFYFTECLGANGDFDTSEFCIAMLDGAKLNNSISSDMTYNELAAVLGEFDVQGVVASFVYYTTIDGYSVGFIFEITDELHQYASQGTVSSDALKVVNPKLQSIGFRTNL